MPAVNALFVLALLFPLRGFIFAAYALWAVYLSFCLRRTTSRVMKGVYLLFLAFAAVMVAVNAYAYFIA